MTGYDIFDQEIHIFFIEGLLEKGLLQLMTSLKRYYNNRSSQNLLKIMEFIVLKTCMNLECIILLSSHFMNDAGQV